MAIKSILHPKINIPPYILVLISTPGPELILDPGGDVPILALRLELKSTPKVVDFNSSHLREYMSFQHTRTMHSVTRSIFEYS